MGYTCENGLWRIDDSKSTQKAAKPKPPSVEDQIREMRASGASYSEIEEKLHVSRKTISKTLNQETIDDHSCSANQQRRDRDSSDAGQEQPLTPSGGGPDELQTEG
jgi:DNA invertase Pin-like site-specific DNA recombinase